MYTCLGNTDDDVFFDVNLPDSRPLTSLYHLQPKGVGTGEVESFKSYFKRISDAHHISPSVLFNEYISLVIKDESELRTWNRRAKFYSMPQFFHNGDLAKSFVSGLEKMTGNTRLDLCTLIPLHSVIESIGLFSRATRFCPLCFSDNLSVNYGRLLWDVGIVTACPLHGCHLVEAVCGNRDMSAPIPELNRKVLDGVCSKCGSIGFRCHHQAQQMASNEAVLVAQLVFELLQMSSSGHKFDPDSLVMGIRKAATKAGDGYPSKGAVNAGLSKGLVSEWIAGKHLPSLPLLLKLCAASGTPLVDIVSNQVKDDLHRSFRLDITPLRKNRGICSTQDRETALKNALAEIPPPSLAEVGRRIDLDPANLRRQFSQLSSQVVSNHRRFIVNKRDMEKKKAENDMEAMILQIKLEGLPITQRNIKHRFGIQLLPNTTQRNGFHNIMNTLAKRL